MRVRTVAAGLANAAIALAAVLPGTAFGQAQTYFDTHATITGPAPGSRFGAAIDCSDGAVTSDTSHIAIGAPNASNGEGRVYVYSLADTPTLLETITAPAPGQDYHFGSAVAFIPDFNSDGRDDLIIGEASDPSTRSPRIYVFESTGATGYSNCNFVSNVNAGFGTVIHGYRLFGNTLNRFIAGIPGVSTALPFELTAGIGVCTITQSNPRSGYPGFGASITEVVGDDDSDSEVDTIIGGPLFDSNKGAVYLTGTNSVGIYTGSTEEEAGTSVAGHRSSSYYAFSRPKSLSGAGDVLVRDLNLNGPLFECSASRGSGGSDFGKVLRHLHLPNFPNLWPSYSAVWAAYRSEDATGGSVGLFTTDSITCGAAYQYNNCAADPSQEQGAALSGGAGCTGHLGGSVKAALLVGSPGYSTQTGRVDIVAEGSSHSSPTVCPSGGGGGGNVPVAPGTGNLPAPTVAVSGKSATVTAPVVAPSLSVAQRKRFSKFLQRKFGLSKSKADRAVADDKLRLTYIFNVKTGVKSQSAPVNDGEAYPAAGSITRRSKRNQVTFNGLPPGGASATYRIEIATRTPPFVLGLTKPSATARFTVQ